MKEEIFAVGQGLHVGRHGPTDRDGQLDVGDVRILLLVLLVARRLIGSRRRLFPAAGQLAVGSDRIHP